LKPFGYFVFRLQGQQQVKLCITSFISALLGNKTKKGKKGDKAVSAELSGYVP
jgi:hypothetical protein